MTCPQCRNELPAAAQFCPGCGYRFPVQVPGTSTPPGSPGAYGGAPPSPYGQAPQGPYGGGAPGPYGSAPPGPYNQPAPGPYGQPAPGPYGQPAPGPYGGAPNPYGVAPVPPPTGSDFVFVLPPGLPTIEDICARGYQVQIGKWLSEGWQIVKPIYWGMVGFLFVAFMINYFTSSVIAGPLMAGLFIVPMRHLKGRPQEFGRYFDGFKAFLPLFLVSMVGGLIVVAGFLALVIPGIYLATAFTWAALLVVDRGMDFWPAMMASMKVVNKNFWGTFGFLLLQGLIVSLGIIPCCLGLIFLIPWQYGMQIAAYRDIFGMNPSFDRCGG
jgi:hypothetical protein